MYRLGFWQAIKSVRMIVPPFKVGQHCPRCLMRHLCNALAISLNRIMSPEVTSAVLSSNTRDLGEAVLKVERSGITLSLFYLGELDCLI